MSTGFCMLLMDYVSVFFPDDWKYYISISICIYTVLVFFTFRWASMNRISWFSTWVQIHVAISTMLFVIGIIGIFENTSSDSSVLEDPVTILLAIIAVFIISKLQMAEYRRDASLMLFTSQIVYLVVGVPVFLYLQPLFAISQFDNTTWGKHNSAAHASIHGMTSAISVPSISLSDHGTSVRSNTTQNALSPQWTISHTNAQRLPPIGPTLSDRTNLEPFSPTLTDRTTLQELTQEYLKPSTQRWLVWSLYILFSAGVIALIYFDSDIPVMTIFLVTLFLIVFYLITSCIQNLREFDSSQVNRRESFSAHRDPIIGIRKSSFSRGESHSSKKSPRKEQKLHVRNSFSSHRDSMIGIQKISFSRGDSYSGKHSPRKEELQADEIDEPKASKV